MEPLELNDEESKFLSSMLHEDLPRSDAPSTATEPTASCSGRPLQKASSRSKRIDELEIMMSSTREPTVLIELLAAYHSESVKSLEAGKSKLAVAFELLQKAQVLAESLPEGSTSRRQWLGAIYSSLAVYFQRSKKYEAALLYLEQASDLEKDMTGSPAAESIASTWLNIAAVLSALGRHTEALGHAERAARSLVDTNSPVVFDETTSVELVQGMSSLRIELIAKSFYNIGCIKEHLNHLQEAIKAYRIASILASKVNDVALKRTIAQALHCAAREVNKRRGRSASLKHDVPQLQRVSTSLNSKSRVSQV